MIEDITVNHRIYGLLYTIIKVNTKGN